MYGRVCNKVGWSRFLFERYACMRPLHRVCGWLSGQGLPVSPGTLADSMHRFAPLFEPVGAAILAHQNGSALRHADETSWRVRALRGRDGPGYAWLWTSVGRGAVCFHIDPSRSAEAAMKLFDGAMSSTVLVCDRYSGYKKLVRLLGGRVTLSFCWAHMRRDFIRCAAGQVRLAGWCREWLGRIATVCRLHKTRLASRDPGLERQTPAFDAAHDALSEALGGMFAAAEHQLARLSTEAREGKPLRSLLNHREGLSVFLDRPRVPLDNNIAERLLRGPAIGRRLSFGSDSESGARFTALMYSVTGTLRLNGIDVLRRLIAGPPALNRHALSKEFCRRIGWFKPDGGLKDMMARVTMLAMHRDGLIVLPPPKWRQSRPGPIVFGQDTEPPLFPPPTTLDEIRPLELRTVVAGTRNPPLHRRRLQGLRLDPRRNHTGTRALRHRQAVRQARQGCLAPPPRQALETHPQPLSPPPHTIRRHDARHGLAEQLPPGRRPGPASAPTPLFSCGITFAWSQRALASRTTSAAIHSAAPSWLTTLPGRLTR